MCRFRGCHLGPQCARKRHQHRSRSPPSVGRRSTISLRSAIAASHSCAARAPSRLGIPLGGHSAGSPRNRLKIDPALVIRIDSAGWSMKDNYHPWRPKSATNHAGLLEKTRDFTPSSALTTLPQSRHPRPQRRGPHRSRRRFRGRLRRHPVRGLLHASLTTVRQPLLEMGKRGAQVLLERIADREKPFPSEIVMARN